MQSILAQHLGEQSIQGLDRASGHYCRRETVGGVERSTNAKIHRVQWRIPDVLVSGDKQTESTIVEPMRY
jgi:hypothetical protein